MNKNEEFGPMLKRRRLFLELTLVVLSGKSGVSASHLGRIERGERFPSGRTLPKIAEALELDENELFVTAGYLSSGSKQQEVFKNTTERVDPYVVRMLSQEPVEVQRAVIGIFNILKLVAKS